MKVSKDALKASKRLFRLCNENNTLNEDKLRTVIKALSERKPRSYKGILVSLHRQLRRYQEQRHVTIESAQQLDEATGQDIANKMISQHGDGLTFEYKINPALLGGIRIRKGDDVWDGTVKARLDKIANAF